MMKGVKIMELPLPPYDFEFENGSGEAKDGILYIYRIGSFDDMMRELTYLVYGKDECYFCHRKFVNQKEVNDDSCFLKSQVTIDHLIPQEFGGPTLPNNMRASCSICNSGKGNYYEDEYAQLKLFGPEDDKARKRFEEQIKVKQGQRKRGEIPIFPEGWCTKENPRKYISIFSLSDHRGNSYQKQKGFFEQYHRLAKIVIVSSNGYVLKGFSTIALALENNISEVDTITLGNVICIDREEKTDK